MNRPLIYKLSTDDNGAPCVTDKLLTLAICKPGYRHVAKKGDYLFGFMGRSQMNGKAEPLVYIAEITDEPMSAMDYYTNPEYVSRPDCIYKHINNEFEIRTNALYHNYADEDISHADRRDADLGKNRDASVLLSTNFRYLGKEAQLIDVEKYPELTALIRRLGQTNYPWHIMSSPAIVSEAEALKDELWAKYSNLMKIGFPMHPPSSTGDCGDGSEICIVVC